MIKPGFSRTKPPYNNVRPLLFPLFLPPKLPHAGTWLRVCFSSYPSPALFLVPHRPSLNRSVLVVSSTASLLVQRPAASSARLVRCGCVQHVIPVFPAQTHLLRKVRGDRSLRFGRELLKQRRGVHTCLGQKRLDGEYYAACSLSCQRVCLQSLCSEHKDLASLANDSRMLPEFTN